MNLQDLLAVVPGDEKRAGIESPDRQQLEQDFSGLAYAFLKDRAPGLLPFLVGFEIVEADEDGSRAVGLFGFAVGKSFYYVPAFFMANQIKGMDLLYSKNDNQFIPLRENWVQHVTDKQTIRLGGSPRDKITHGDMDRPDFNNMFLPPTSGAGSLSGAPDDMKMGQVMQDLCGTWNKMQASAVEMLGKDAKFGEVLGNAILNIAHPHVMERLGDKQGSELIDFVVNKGGPAAAVKLARAMTDPEFVKIACRFYEPQELLISVFDASLQPKQAADKKVTVVTATSDYNGKDNKYRTKLVRDSFYIDDKREDDEKSEVFNEDYTKSVTSPTCSGRYKAYLVDEGLTEACVLFPNHGGLNAVIVYLPKNKQYFTASNTKVSVSAVAEDSPVPDTRLYDSAEAISEIKPGHRYFLVDKDMNATAPFDVKSVSSSGTGADSILSLGIDFQTDVKYEDYRSRDSMQPCSPYDGGQTKLIPTTGGGKIRRSGSTYLVPLDAWKAIDLGTKADLENDSIYGNANCVVRPADAADIFTAMLKAGCHRMTVQSDDNGLAYAILLDDIVDSHRLNYKSACVRLVTHFGLGVDDTEAMLKEAGATFKSRRTVKLAQVSMPTVPGQPMGQDPTTGLPLMEPQYEQLPIAVDNGQPPQPSGAGTGINMGGEGAMQSAGGSPGGGPPADGSGVDPETMAMLQAAGQSGQRQVFDHGMIGSLTKAYDASTMIDGFIPEMMKALDRVGRTLFLFYWKNEDFAERYGAQDLMEVEDQIRAVFKQFGDLILRLKQKSIDQAESMV